MTSEQLPGQPSEGKQPFGGEENVPSEHLQPEAWVIPPPVQISGQVWDMPLPAELSVEESSAVKLSKFYQTRGVDFGVTNGNTQDCETIYWVDEKTDPLSFVEETRQRMEELGTNDPAEAMIDMFTPYLLAHAQMTSDEQAAAREQGRQWRLKREELCLSEDDVAQQAGVSPHALMYMEHGFPPLGGVSENLAQRISLALNKDGLS